MANNAFYFKMQWKRYLKFA